MMMLAFNLIVVGSAIALTVALAFAVAKSAAPRVRYAIAVIAFFAAAVIPVVIPSVSEGPGRAGGSQSVPTRAAGSLAPARDDLRVELPQAPSAEKYAVILWLAIATILLAREFLGHAALHFRRRDWDRASRAAREQLDWPAGVELFTAENEAPATIGLLHPVVVLPGNWLDPRVARHELAHARWRDPLVNAIVRVVRAILWPSVPLWFLERIIRTEREVSADAYAIGGDKSAAVEYAGALVTAASRRPLRAATALGNGIGLEERIDRLFLAARPSSARLALAAAVLLTGAAATSAVPVAAPDLVPPLHVVPDRATPEYVTAARAMNEILSRTEFHNHEATPTVHQLLGRMRAAGTVQPLLDALGAPDLRTREAVAWIAGELRDPALVPALIGRLHDPDPHVRETAAWALGTIGDRRAAGPLKTAMHSSDSRTRHGATWAFERLQRKD
jgi:beta-lactamase regulating signal transducer with metallopeptidase domain